MSIFLRVADAYSDDQQRTKTAEFVILGIIVLLIVLSGIYQRRKKKSTEAVRKCSKCGLFVQIGEEKCSVCNTAAVPLIFSNESTPLVLGFLFVAGVMYVTFRIVHALGLL
ncbi:MAG: LPXTG cell wall anchor domain-containing protein [Actinobacteria bacterium]|uniref:Unannotated protein n=1 Tax=freshwater metagenome TaxID=449393 RepID=A0A6J6XE47_9ZZZZ|nr:LPXTG cell wall anchor domain-containing protein [Actinomycetota bacterium]